MRSTFVHCLIVLHPVFFNPRRHFTNCCSQHLRIPILDCFLSTTGIPSPMHLPIVAIHVRGSTLLSIRRNLRRTWKRSIVSTFEEEANMGSGREGMGAGVRKGGQSVKDKMESIRSTYISRLWPSPRLLPWLSLSTFIYPVLIYMPGPFCLPYFSSTYYFVTYAHR